MRSLLRQVAFVSVVVLALAGFARPASAELVLFQIGSFSSSAGLYSYDDATGSLTGTTNGTFTFDPVFAALFGVPVTPFLGASLQIDAAATDIVTCGGPICTQPFDGFIEVRAADTTLLLRADFTDALLFGILGGSSVTLNAETETVQAATIIYTSDVFDVSQLLDPKSLNFVLTPLSPSLALSTNGNFRDFSSEDIANFSATVDVVPEPAMLVLFGLGLTGVGAAVRRRRSNSKA